jgi:hypothetical protein
MASVRELSRCRDRLGSLSQATLDCDAFRLEAISYLQRAIGFDRWCWPLADPETLVTSSGLAEHNYGPHVPRSLQRTSSRRSISLRGANGRSAA